MKPRKDFYYSLSQKPRFRDKLAVFVENGEGQKLEEFLFFCREN